MEGEMLAMAIKAAGIVSDPTRLSFLALGVFMGLVLGVIPGLGGLVGLSLLLPFTFNMDPYTALALMIGLASVTVTSDTIPAVLFGVPGTVGSAATILDGYPMARKGEAGRAFGAAFTASVIGGLFGAALLALSVPVLRPIMLSIGTPELLAVCVFGLSLVAVLSGGTALKGLAAACLGILIATAGDDPRTGELRWTFDTTYLWDGLPIVPFALGLFAIPELADMAVSRTAIAGDAKFAGRWSQLQGVKDVFKNWFLVLRCSAIGSGLGSIPGIGASVIDWVAYGHAARSEKGADETFGKGDVRGVIASESSNNAKEGGALVPTIAFGVPGSASMALLLGAFLIHGLVPGPKMLTTQLDITYTLVWSIAIANILGAGVCFLGANQLAKIAQIRIGILVPVVLAVTFVGAFQGSRAWGDLYALLIFGALGWFMKRVRWPRPPLILGFVLGGLVERYLFISVNRYGVEWLTHPVVMVFGVLTIYGILRPVVKNYRKRASRPRGGRAVAFQKDSLDPDMAFTGALAALFAVSLWVSAEWEFGALLMPQVIGWGGLGFTGLLLFNALFVARVETAAAGPKGASLVEDTKDHLGGGDDQYFDIRMDFGHLERRTILTRAAAYFGWCLAFLAIAKVIGLLPSLLIFLAGYIRYEGRESWKMALSIALPTWGLSYLLFHTILRVPWPHTLLSEWFPALRVLPSAYKFF